MTSWFEPSQANGLALRQVMDTSLWSSVAGVLVKPIPAMVSDQRASPLDFGAYSDLVLDLSERQRLTDEARADAKAHLLARLAERSARKGEGIRFDRPRICNFSEDTFTPAHLRRLHRWFATEEATSLGLAPTGEEQFGHLSRELNTTLDYLEKADPELFGEFLAIVDDIILVSPDTPLEIEFTSGSSFAIWGAIFGNGDALQHWTESYNMLAHEEGHLLLFAIARDEPLVLNGNERTYVSPVRDDLRPIDGIFHTAFVVAREARALNQLIIWGEKNGAFSTLEQDMLAVSLEVSVISFWQSIEALENHATLSELGKSIMEECVDYMSRNFELVME